MVERQGIGHAAGAIRVTAAANYPATLTEQNSVRSHIVSGFS